MNFAVGLVTVMVVALILLLFLYPLIITSMVSGCNKKAIKEWFYNWGIWWFIIPILLYSIERLGNLILN